MLQVTLHILAALAVSLSAVPFWLICLLMVLVFVSLLRTIRDYRSPSLKQIRKLIHNSEKGWTLFSGDSIFDKAKLLPSTVSTRFCLFMHFEDSKGKRHYLMVPRDKLSFDHYRQLRVLLKVSM
ncbi:MAG: hypothetical protein DRQ61_10100 [Gammaproteobacteria bacterium]|nr:MAG: hypothetical protein DRQ56_05645 [Gammaproteobacteria bacterium]RLA20356.1 MAG: hypothetical protein DRQ61_10100 [Gammaproteobacteria bacterium]